LKTEVSSWKHL